MLLENLVFDAAEPNRLGRFWEDALGTQTLTDNADGYETRLTVEGGPTLDLCFQPVDGPAAASPRLHLDLHGQGDQAATVERLLGLGASRLDIGQGDVPWVVLADPEGHAFCVMEERDAYRDTGPVAAIPILVGDPTRDAAFWSELSGWREYDGPAPMSLRHPSGRGLVLEFFSTAQPKVAKNQLHLDLRLESGDDRDAVFERVQALGARRLENDWGDLPWVSFTDPSGNEFCILPVSSS
jgi:predicted enzyme related to lactoylglutathione lyase